jgi:hypothetical protein
MADLARTARGPVAGTGPDLRLSRWRGRDLNPRPSGYETGDGGHYETARPGTPEDPAVRHMYETKGVWPLSLEVSWSGSYTVSGYGVSFAVDGLSVAGSDTLEYQVIEVRGVIDDDRA